MSEEMNVIEPKTSRTWTEAPASATVKSKYRSREWMITLRGETGAEVIHKIDQVSDWLDKHAEAMNIEIAPNAPTVTAPPAPVTQSTSGMGGTFRIVKMSVAPRTDGKVDLSFFEAGHQYADIKATKTPNDAVALLHNTGAWTVQHFAAIAEYPVSMLIDWKPSEKLNSKGNPYKNIVTVSPA